MLLRIDAASSQPLYEQLADAIRQACTSGELADGERMPTARDLAEQLGVNMHTVLRAYSSLQAEGLLRVRRGRGAVVVTPAPVLPPAVVTALDRLLSVAHQHEVPREHLLNALKVAP